MAAETTNTYPMTPPTQSVFSVDPFEADKKKKELEDLPNGKKMEITPVEETTSKDSSK